MTNEKMQKIGDILYFVDSRVLDGLFVNEGFVFDLREDHDYMAIRVYHDDTRRFAISDLGKVVFTTVEEANEVIRSLPNPGTGMYRIHMDNSISRVVIHHYDRLSMHFYNGDSIGIIKFKELLFPTKEAAIQALKNKK